MNEQEIAEDQSVVTRTKELGWVQLEKPLVIDVQELQSSHFSDGRFLIIANGDSYILDRYGKTILLFADNSGDGFQSIYSPLSPVELKSLIYRLPQAVSETISLAFNLQYFDMNYTSPAHPRHTTFVSKLFTALTRNHATPSDATYQPPEREPIDDLPKDHFIELSAQEFETKRHEHWERIRNLDDNDPNKIVYLRRFTSEFSSTVRFDPELTALTSEPYRYYAVDATKFDELPKIEPYQTRIDVPQDKKIGIIIGYHHLEKPWGYILKTAFEDQVGFNHDQIKFVLVENMDIPTGDQSVRSNREIEQAVQMNGITHVIHLHEQLAKLNHYMDSFFQPIFRQETIFSIEGECTLDPFVPTWMIEQYYEGYMYPQLQHAVNEQIKKIEQLILTI